MSVSGSFSARLDFHEIGSHDLGSKRAEHVMELAKGLAAGTGDNQVNLAWSDRRSLAATSEDLDLSGGLTGAFGDTLTFSKVKVIVIRNNDDTDNLTVGGAAANQFASWVADASDKVVIAPEGYLVLVAPLDGYAVTAGTADLLKVDAGAATISYDIAVIGLD